MSELEPASPRPVAPLSRITDRLWVVPDSTVPARDRALLRRTPPALDEHREASGSVSKAAKSPAAALLTGTVCGAGALTLVIAGAPVVAIWGVGLLVVSGVLTASAVKETHGGDRPAQLRQQDGGRRRRDEVLARGGDHWTLLLLPPGDPLSEVLAAVERVESSRAVREHVIAEDLVAAILDEAHLLATAHRDVTAMDRDSGDPLRRRAASAVTARGRALLAACRSVDDVDRVLGEQDTARAARAAEDRDLQLLARLEGTPLETIEHGAAAMEEWTASMRRSLAVAQESIGQLPTAGGER